MPGSRTLGRLQPRVQVNPFNLVGTLIFLHTLLAARFTALSHELEKENARLNNLEADQALDISILKESASGNF